MQLYRRGEGLVGTESGEGAGWQCGGDAGEGVGREWEGEPRWG